MLAACKQDWRTHWGKWWYRLAGIDPEEAPKPAEPYVEEKPDAALLVHLQSWFQLQALRRGYAIEWVELYWQAYCYELRLSAVVCKGGHWLVLEAKTYGKTSEESWGSASHEAYDRYTRLLDDADRYLAAGACRAMIRGRFSGLVEL